MSHCWVLDGGCVGWDDSRVGRVVLPDGNVEMSRDVLAQVLGAEYWVSRVPDVSGAIRQACARMAQGRAATYWIEGGAVFVAWGVKGSAA